MLWWKPKPFFDVVQGGGDKYLSALGVQQVKRYEIRAK